MKEIPEVEKLLGGKPSSSSNVTSKRGGEMMTQDEMKAKIKALAGKTDQQVQNELAKEMMGGRR